MIYQVDDVIVTNNHVIVLFSDTWSIQNVAKLLFFTADISHLLLFSNNKPEKPKRLSESAVYW